MDASLPLRRIITSSPAPAAI